MKNFLLLSVFALFWNCTIYAQKTLTSNKAVPDEESVNFKTNFKAAPKNKNALKIASLDSLEKYFDKSDRGKFFESVHKISNIDYEQNVSVYKSSINKGGNFYYVKVLQNNNKFKNLVDSLNANETKDEYVRFDLPKTNVAKDIDFKVAKNGYCDFADGVSVYHEEFLQYLLSKPYKKFLVVKGRELIDPSKVYEKCPKKNKKGNITKEYTEAQIYMLLDDKDDPDKYYNLSHIPPPDKVNAIKNRK